ncbi:glucose-6-phosphate dehydrogenase [Dactylosporangium fulvum]|uniref:Glucose-6-phosphate 1-dehydrogenase n=1 Tax=Dactylosporangium fulvum TaxID=53359 RepID=A0ABY5WAJ1_9ACTN|nr:glucose-6-phosphate dehydrogenase (NADP(+)) [Dactylosporangium fulvum]UWP86316.1 glucose-6-phosphate dehydrogenase (NADP(+)) [Dactylosporangium fulvum]
MTVVPAGGRAPGRAARRAYGVIVMATTTRARRATIRPCAQPTVFVLFGATGDLARRMVLPAFMTLALERLLPDDWVLIGNGRGDLTHEDFRDHVREALDKFGPHPDKRAWRDFERRLLFAGHGFDKHDPGRLLDVIGEARERVGDDAQLVHYLAVPPVTFAGITEALGAHGLAEGARVVYEKPFGTSPASFRTLNRTVRSVLDEEQVYRIDHFLGKEATQNLHVLRFANELFGAAWHRDHIESVQIDVPETLGITDRAAFYDATGAVLDMLVTHLFQVAAEVTMEPPASLGATDLQAAREKVIRSFRPLDPAEVVLGQFTGYRDEPGVAARSRTDTFVAARLWIDNPRWRGVPFLLRTGKRLAVSEERVSLVLRTPHGPFGELPGQANVISFSLSGSGEIDVRLLAKKPGVELYVEPADARLPLAQLPDAAPLPPYVRLIHDILLGDRSLFTRPDGLSAVWKVAQPLLDNRPRPQPYPQGSWGPPQARRLAAPRKWLVGQ